MSPDFVPALLSANRQQVVHKNETPSWDYKVRLDLEHKAGVAEFAKDVLAFHNAGGGAIVVGVSDDYHVLGVQRNELKDSKLLSDKIDKYSGGLKIFQEQISVPGSARCIWVVFVPGHQGRPRPCHANGPIVKKRNVIEKGAVYIREGDETRKCRDQVELDNLFLNSSLEHLTSYTYEVDLPYFTLLSPHCATFVGRQNLLDEMSQKLFAPRTSSVMIEGVGGVGKTELAITFLRGVFDRGEAGAIISMSAKNLVWGGHGIKSKAGTFSDFFSFVTEACRVLGVEIDGETADDASLLLAAKLEEIERPIVLLDNLENVDDGDLYRYLNYGLPAHVKVILTSRLYRDIGGRLIVVDGMTMHESLALLQAELDRVGMGERSKQERDIMNDVVQAAGGLPLAIKWAAGIAAQRDSLIEVSQILRQETGDRQRLLQFCFKTMFDELSDGSKRAALLIPYLRESWNPTLISLALGVDESTALTAMNELDSRGLVHRARPGSAPRVLPLTMAYLDQRWNEDAPLRTSVRKKLSFEFGNNTDSVCLLDIKDEEKSALLIRVAEDATQRRDYPMARKALRSARTWSTEPEIDYLEGLLSVELGYGEAHEGERLIRAALARKKDDAKWDARRWWYVDKLRSRGDSDAAFQEMQLLKDMLRDSWSPSSDVAGALWEIAVRTRSKEVLVEVLEQVTTAEQVVWAFERLTDPQLTSSLLDDAVLSTANRNLIRLRRKGVLSPEEEDLLQERWLALQGG